MRKYLLLAKDYFMSLPETTHKPQGFIRWEVMEAKPSEVLLLAWLCPDFYLQPDGVGKLLVPMNVFARGLMGDNVHSFHAPCFHSSLITTSIQNMTSEWSINDRVSIHPGNNKDGDGSNSYDNGNSYGFWETVVYKICHGRSDLSFTDEKTGVREEW